MKDNICVYLDAGHGGIDPKGNYTTAPSKMFDHKTGVFHKGSVFYEGVWNRTLINRVSDKLGNLGIRHVKVHHDYLDTPLEYRVDMANWYHRNFAQGIYISTHANAANGQARGFEVYTSRGQTAADPVATLLFNTVQELFGNRITYRTDYSDGDPDKEAGFFVLTKTAMPAILIEHLFFDNIHDARLLMDDEVVDLFAEAQVRTIIKHFS